MGSTCALGWDGAHGGKAQHQCGPILPLGGNTSSCVTWNGMRLLDQNLVNLGFDDYKIRFKTHD